MLVCHCHGVTDRQIRRLVRNGATTESDIARACGAGSCCGGCQNVVRKLVRIESAAKDSSSSPAHAPAITDA